MASSLASSPSRRSYRGLSALPAWLLFDGYALIASARAENADDAHALFKRHGLAGTHIAEGDTARMKTKHAKVWRGKPHDSDTCLMCAGERLAALVRAALNRPGAVTGKDFRPAVEAFERLARE